jgi:prophage regulatory protein
MVDPPPLAALGQVERRLLTEKAVRAATGLSASTVWRMRRDGLFPQPVRISRGRVGWPESVVLAWMTARAREEPLPTPLGDQSPSKPPRGRPRGRPRAATAKRHEPAPSETPAPQTPSPQRQAAPVRRRRSVTDERQLGFDFGA